MEFAPEVDRSLFEIFNPLPLPAATVAIAYNPMYALDTELFCRVMLLK